ncbi:cytochrome ubiquinol oxidase subunit II [Acetobacteraceae bacterium KSS8]|uniref:Cytochrome ubiquinol oxidase subunit II n=1 Tax=Endosaccharibacter trunci TaxID=2812733 RepID=A0ABT1W7Z3_9PROT|nr:cytochrome ubiquinol oxidase subunit II [Acetobacteraceae bacterium KSS8]
MAAAPFWFALLLVVLSGCAQTGSSMLHPWGMVAAAQRDWLVIAVALMMIVVLPVFVMVPLFAWRYRRRGGRGVYRPNWTYARVLEYPIWGVPVLIVAALAVMVATRETDLDPYRPLPGAGAPLEIDVVALDWKFLFIYPKEHVASVGLLAIPRGRPVSFHLTSDATMQSFFIPALGSQIYAMAGMETQLHLRADRDGVLDGENTQYNGADFQNEHVRVEVVPDASFARFLAECRVAGRVLDPSSYRMLAVRDTLVKAKAAFGLPPDGRLLFGDVQPGLFASIIAKYHPGDRTMRMAGQAE